MAYRSIVAQMSRRVGPMVGLDEPFAFVISDASVD